MTEIIAFVSIKKDLTGSIMTEIIINKACFCMSSLILKYLFLIIVYIFCDNFYRAAFIKTIKDFLEMSNNEIRSLYEFE